MVVDTLRFSTTVVTALHHGAAVIPCLDPEEAAAVARRTGAVPAGMAAAPGGLSLSPLDYVSLPPGTRVALASPNGAACARLAAGAPHLLVAAPVNARAVAARVSALLAAAPLRVTVVACGERWPADDEDGALRFAEEDYLGAGALLSGLALPLSAAAHLCAAAFCAAHRDLAALLHHCPSGEELVARGCAADVDHAAQLDRYDTVPQLRDGWFRPLSPEP